MLKIIKKQKIFSIKKQKIIYLHKNKNMAIRYTTLDERKEACIRTLVRFMRENGIYFKYQNEIYKDGALSLNYNEFDLCKLIKKLGGTYGDGHMGVFTRAFTWSKTKNGRRYWSDMLYSWLNYYDNNIKKQEIYRRKYA